MFGRHFPYGLLIRPDVLMDKMRDLASRYSLVCARGFGPVDCRQKAREMGTILSVHPLFFAVQSLPDEIIDHGFGVIFSR